MKDNIMKKMLKTFALGCALLPFAQCTTLVGAPSALAAEPVAAAAPAALRDVDPALWVVKDKDTTIYLFGTVHLLKPGLSWFDDGVKSAFDKSDELRIEVVLPDDPASMAPLVLGKAVDQTGKTMSSRLNETQRATYTEGMKKLGLDPAQLEPFEPWFIGLQATMLMIGKAGYQPNSGAEEVLKTAAKSANKPIKGLETVEEQMGFLDGAPETEQIVSLMTIVEKPEEGMKSFDAIVESWGKGDIKKAGALLNEGMKLTPGTAQILLYGRNERWAEWIDNRLDQPGTVFVAVGAGHLAGKNSVQHYLGKRKLKAVRVKY
jgi:uncharacterized protein YbaP (TraB family)